MPSDASPPEPDSTVPTGKKRRWLKRLLKLGAAGFILMIAGVLFAPTLALSGWVERRVSKYIEGRIGRPITIEGISFGWRTPFSFERIIVPAVEGEQGYPMAVIEGISSPMTLSRVFRLLPIDFESLQIERVEMNLVRLPDGKWNVLELQKRLMDPDAEEKPVEEVEAPGAARPLKLPVRFSEIRVKRMDFRVVDSSQPLVAGAESGSVVIRWAGGTEPIVIEAAGEIRVNDRRMPWDIQAVVSDWIEEDRTIVWQQAAVKFGTDDLASPAMIADGGFFVRAALKEKLTSEARGVVPLKKVIELAEGYPLEFELPTLDGELRGKLEFKHEGPFSRWEVNGELSGHGLSVSELGADGLSVPSQEVLATVEAKIDIDQQRIDSVEMEFVTGPMSGKLSGRGISWAELGVAEEFSVEWELDLAEASRLGAQVLKGEDRTALDGHISFRAALSPSEPEVNRLIVNVDFAPGSLATLQPFVEDPAWLSEEPLDLAPLGFKLEAVAEAHLKEKRFAVSLTQLEGAFIENAVARVTFESETGRWDAEVHGVLGLGRAFDQYSPIFLPDALDRFEGKVMLDASARSVGEDEIETTGRLTLVDLVVQPNELEFTFSEPRSALQWNARFNPKTMTARIASVTAKNSLATLSLSGELGQENSLDFAGTFELNLERVAGLAAEFTGEDLPVEGEIKGALRANFKAAGTIGEKLELGFDLAGTDPLDIHFKKLVFAPWPPTIETSARVLWRDGALDRVQWSKAAFALGEVVRAGSQGELLFGDRMSVEASLQAELSFAPALELIHPDFWERSQIEAVIEGKSTVRITVAGPLLSEDPEALAPKELEIDGEWNTEIEVAEVAAEGTTAVAESILFANKFSLRFDPELPAGFVFIDDSRLTVAAVESSEGVVIADITMKLGAEISPGRPFRITLEEFSIAEGLVEREGLAAEIPPVRVTAAVQVDPENTSVGLERLEVEIEGIGSSSISAKFDWETMDFEATASARAPALDRILPTMGLSEIGAIALPELAGGFEFSANVKGTVPEGDLDLMAEIPIHAAVRVQWNDIAIEHESGIEIAGLSGRFNLDLKDGLKSVKTDFQMSVDRIAYEALPIKPVESLSIRTAAAFEDFDRLTLSLDDLSVANYGFATNARAEVEGLNDIVTSGKVPGLEAVFDDLDFSASFSLHENLSGLDGVVEGVQARGELGWDVTVRGTAGHGLLMTSEMTSRAVDLWYRDLARVSGLEGQWTSGVSLPMREGLATPKSPPEGRFSADRIVLNVMPYRVEIQEGAVRLRGFQSGLDVRAETKNLLGGPSTTRWNFHLIDGDPTLTGRVHVTGMDLGKLMPLLADLEGPEAELNGVADVSIRIPEDLSAGLLNNVTLRVQSSRIGRKALSRLIEALDPEQEDPRFQKALTALKIGRPKSVLVELRDSLLTFEVVIEGPAGIAMDLPILDREPLGDLEQVYGLDQYRPLVQSIRPALLMLLAEDFTELRRNLQSTEKN